MKIARSEPSWNPGYLSAAIVSVIFLLAVVVTWTLARSETQKRKA